MGVAKAMQNYGSTDMAGQADATQAQPQAGSACSWRAGDAVVMAAALASTFGVLLISTTTGYSDHTASGEMSSVGSTCALIFLTLLAAFHAARIAKGDRPGGIDKGTVSATLFLACLSVLVWAVGTAWTMADLRGSGPTTAARLLGSGMIACGMMSMFAVVIMTEAFLNFRQLRATAVFVHCSAVLAFEGLFILGYAAALLKTDIGDEGKEGLQTQAAGGSIAAAALIMLMFTSGGSIGQVCLCVLLAIGVVVAEAARIYQATNMSQFSHPMHAAIAYMHVINAAAVTGTVLTTWSTERTAETQICSSGTNNGAQRPVAGEFQRTNRVVGDTVLTGAVFASAAGTLLLSAVTGFVVSAPIDPSEPQALGLGGDGTSGMLSSVGSTSTLVFLALLAAFHAARISRGSRPGGIDKGAVYMTLLLACLSAVVWAVGLVWTFTSITHDAAAPVRMLGIGIVVCGMMSMLAVVVMTEALVSSGTLRGAAAFLHCCALLAFESLSVLGFAAQLLDNVSTHDDHPGVNAQIAGGAIATAVLAILTWTSASVQCGHLMYTTQVCLCMLLAIGVLVTEAGRVYQNNNFFDPVYTVVTTTNPTLAYVHIINAVAVTITVLTTCTPSALPDSDEGDLPQIE